MPAGPVGDGTYANESVWGAAERAWTTVRVPADGLVAGDNVLAIEVHNDWRGGPDIAVDAALTAIDEAVERPPEDEVFVSFGGTWRYDDTGAQRNDTAWRQTGFDDGDWSAGPAPVRLWRRR